MNSYWQWMQHGSGKVYSMTDKEIEDMLEEILEEEYNQLENEDDFDIKDLVEIVKKHLRGKLALSATKE